ncbi:uncharacterized protein EAE97_010431 [Botrytis byssoidea]|uniref:Uncharacterized protein n=1 Tax=Botrytis byssoidea TaxID=139641 RepID=A0A9P5LVF5_9HELO|nr:uncharacterized protein EAE97_010431 [Botrytis byssoidea]KAF7926131.1 hypothetical protein EAE97_010431 [Botrytis byssoidea]
MAMATVAVVFYLLLDLPKMLGRGEKRNEGILASESCKKYAGKVDTPDVYLSIGFDPITENDTPRLPADIVSAMGHGKRKLVLTLPWPEEYSNLEDVEVFKSAAALLGTNAQDMRALSFNDFMKDALERDMWLSLRR